MINRISICGFRSIEKIVFDFKKEKKDIICILGKNGSGKSNVFKAIDYYFRYINKPYSEEKIIDNSNPYIQKCTISISFDLKLLSKKAEHNEQLRSKFEYIDEYIHNNYEHNWLDNSEIELTMTQFRDGSIQWSINDQFICDTIKSFFPIFYIDTRHLDLYTWDKLWQIISNLSSSKISEKYKDILDDAFSNIFGDKYNTSKNFIEQAFNELGISLDQYHFGDRYKNAFSMRFGGTQFVVDGHSLDYYSDGTSSYTYLTLLTTLIPRISDTSCKYPILLIDEPEIGLHNQLISEYVECLCENIKTKALCMITTHSATIIADLCNKKADYALYRIDRKGFYSIVNKMNTKWIDNSNFRITTRETECYFSDAVVYVEGETEIQLFSHHKIQELFHKIRNVHFYSCDSNDKRLRQVLPVHLNLGTPYRILIDMDKILNYNRKNKFNIRSEKTINPLSIEVNEESEHYRYYNDYKSPDYLSIRNNIYKLINKSYSVIPNKNYIDDKDYNEMMFGIINFCNMYNVIANWSTIEGCIITYENIEFFIEYAKTQSIKNHKQFDEICNELDPKEKTILMLGTYNGKSEVFGKIRLNGIEVSKNSEKTSGWITNWFDYYFYNRIDNLESESEKREQFKTDFPQLYNTLQIIENMI